MSYPEPRYLGADGEVSAVLRRADRPYDLEMGQGGTQVHYLVTGAATKGEFGLYRWDFTGPPSGPDRTSTRPSRSRSTYSSTTPTGSVIQNRLATTGRRPVRAVG